MKRLPDVQVVETVNLDMYLIPTPATTFGKLIRSTPEKNVVRVKDDFNAMGFEMEAQDIVVRTWITDTLPDTDIRHCDHWNGRIVLTGNTCGLQLSPAPHAWRRELLEEAERARCPYESTPFMLPVIFPADLFVGKKERESVEVVSKTGVRYVFRLSQKNYRYRTHGKFQDVFAKVVYDIQ